MAIKLFPHHCPHCGSDGGSTPNAHIMGSCCKGFAREKQYNEGIYESARLTGRNLVYCQNCDKVIYR